MEAKLKQKITLSVNNLHYFGVNNTQITTIYY